MERFDTNVGSADATFQQAPVVFESVRVNLSVNILNCMVNDLMSVIGCKAVVGKQEIRIERRSSFNMLTNFRLQEGLLAAGDYHRPNLAAALQDSHNSNLAFRTSPGDAALAFGDVHITRFAS